MQRILRLARRWPGHVTFLVCLVCLSQGASGETLSESERRDLLQEGEDLFRKANELATNDSDQAKDLYQKAVLRFERIVREGGIENGRLYYNIGNSYFRMNDLGRAILNYRRAQRFIPNDPNLHQNLDYARARRLDRVELNQQTRLLRTLLFWHYDLSMRLRAGLFTVSFTLVWIIAAIRMFWRRPFQTWVLWASGGISLLMLGSILAAEWSWHRTRPGVVISQEVVARKGDSHTYEPSFQDPLHAGTEFTLLEERGAWRHIELLDGQRTWIPAQSSDLVH